MAARSLQPCGTVAAYRRHKRRDEDPCEPCRKAYNAHYAEDSNARTWQKARQRALVKLSHIHPITFAALLRHELEEEQKKQRRRRAR